MGACVSQVRVRRADILWVAPASSALSRPLGCNERLRSLRLASCDRLLLHRSGCLTGLCQSRGTSRDWPPPRGAPREVCAHLSTEVGMTAYKLLTSSPHVRLRQARVPTPSLLVCVRALRCPWGGPARAREDSAQQPPQATSIEPYPHALLHLPTGRSLPAVCPSACLTRCTASSARRLLVCCVRHEHHISAATSPEGSAAAVDVHALLDFHLSPARAPWEGGCLAETSLRSSCDA